MSIPHWTIDTAARIVENEDYVVSLYDLADGDYDVAHIRAKHPSPAGLIPANDTIAREARVAFALAMRQRHAGGF